MKKYYLILVLACVVLLSFGCVSKPDRKKICPIIYSHKNMHKEKIKEFKNFNIESISFSLWGRKKEYKKEIKTSHFRKFKFAIISQSKPFTNDKIMQEAAAESAAYGDIVFYSKKRKITIDLCDEMFFWGGKRKLKYAFVSKELTKLIIEEIKKIKDQKDVGWIIEVLQENIKSSSEEKGKQ